MSADIMVSHDSGICEIRLDRTAKKNAITRQMYAAMAEALDLADRDDAVRVILLAANGDMFSAGNDIGDFLANRDTPGQSPVQAFLSALATARKPLIAVVQGKAVGIGTTMLLHCDMVLADPGAQFVAPFVNLGLVPEAGSSLLLPALMGHKRAFAFIALGETLDAESALGLGLINRIVPVERLDEEGRRVAVELAAKPPRALLATKQLLRGDRTPLIERIRQESEQFSIQLQSPEAREVLTAFVEKRPPNFAVLN